MTKFEKYEKAVIKYLLENYPDWESDIKSDALCICEHGEAYIGATQFKTDLHFEQF